VVELSVAWVENVVEHDVEDWLVVGCGTEDPEEDVDDALPPVG